MDSLHIHGYDRSHWWIFAHDMGHEEVPLSMDKYSIPGRNILSMDLKYP